MEAIGCTSTLIEVRVRGVNGLMSLPRSAVGVEGVYSREESSRLCAVEINASSPHTKISISRGSEVTPPRGRLRNCTCLQTSKSIISGRLEPVDTY